MISFSQILILIFLAILFFGDSQRIFNKILLFLVNLKTLFKKVSSNKKDNDLSPKQ